MGLIAMTETGGSSFRLNEKNILMLYTTADSKSMVEYLDAENGLKKRRQIDETSAAIYALTNNMITSTKDGSTIYFNLDRITIAKEVDSLAVISFDDGTGFADEVTLDVDLATLLAAATTDLSNKKIYRANLTQTGTDAPVATVLENTLGGTLVWARTGVGVYTATLSGAFTANKTFAVGVTGLDSFFGIVRTDANVMTLTVSDDAGAAADAALTGGSVEIIVYV